MNDFLNNLKNKKYDKKTIRLILLGVVAVVVIVFSEFSSAEKTEVSEEFPVLEYSAQYINKTEKELQQMLEEIDGAGNVRVMVTLESCYENVYAKSYENQNQQTKDSSEGTIKESYVTVKNGSNNEECLIVKVYEPKIKGVAVVCEGGDDLSVKKAVTQTVCALFDISSAEVSVTKMNES